MMNRIIGKQSYW